MRVQKSNLKAFACLAFALALVFGGCSSSETQQEEEEVAESLDAEADAGTDAGTDAVPAEGAELAGDDSAKSEASEETLPADEAQADLAAAPADTPTSTPTDMPADVAAAPEAAPSAAPDPVTPPQGDVAAIPPVPAPESAPSPVAPEPASPSAAVGEVASASSSFQGTGEFVEYTVQPGDTLMKIAFENYGDLYLWKKVLQDNKDKIQNPSSLTNGASLKIEKPSQPLAVEKNGEKYLIRMGDTLGKISNNVYGTPKKWRKLWENNRQLIKDPNKIYAGFYLYYQPEGPSVQHAPMAGPASGAQSAREPASVSAAPVTPVAPVVPAAPMVVPAQPAPPVAVAPPAPPAH